MALIMCPECGGKVSDTCEQCPHCGFRIKKQFGKAVFRTSIQTKMSFWGKQCEITNAETKERLALLNGGDVFVLDVKEDMKVKISDEEFFNETVCLHSDENVEINIFFSYLGLEVKKSLLSYVGGKRRGEECLVGDGKQWRCPNCNEINDTRYIYCKDCHSKRPF